MSDGFNRLQILGVFCCFYFCQNLRMASSPGSSQNPKRWAPSQVNTSCCPVPSPETRSPSTHGPEWTRTERWALEETMNCCRRRTSSRCSSGLKVLHLQPETFLKEQGEQTVCVSVSDGSESITKETSWSPWGDTLTHCKQEINQKLSKHEGIILHDLRFRLED